MQLQMRTYSNVLRNGELNQDTVKSITLVAEKI